MIDGVEGLDYWQNIDKLIFVFKVIEGTVGASGVDLNNPQNLVELIISQLRPVVFKAVVKVLQGQSYQNIDPQKLTVR